MMTFPLNLKIYKGPPLAKYDEIPGVEYSIRDKVVENCNVTCYDISYYGRILGVIQSPLLVISPEQWYSYPYGFVTWTLDDPNSVEEIHKFNSFEEAIQNMVNFYFVYRL